MIADTRATRRRQCIISSARDLFSLNGFHATGVAQIAIRSRVAVGQIYRDFESKEAIVAAIIASDARKFLAADDVANALERHDKAAVRHWIHHFVDPAKRIDDARLFAEIIAESSRNSMVSPILANIHHGVRTNISDALKLFAPMPIHQSGRDALADTILTLSIGLLHQTWMNQCNSNATLSLIRQLIDREIDKMESHAKSFTSDDNQTRVDVL